MSIGNDLKGRVALVTGGAATSALPLPGACRLAGAVRWINGRRDRQALETVATAIAAAGGPALPVTGRRRRCGRRRSG